MVVIKVIVCRCTSRALLARVLLICYCAEDIVRLVLALGFWVSSALRSTATKEPLCIRSRLKFWRADEGSVLMIKEKPACHAEVNAVNLDGTDVVDLW